MAQVNTQNDLIDFNFMCYYFIFLISTVNLCPQDQELLQNNFGTNNKRRYRYGIWGDFMFYESRQHLLEVRLTHELLDI
jgi:hypothetical protein